MLLFKKRLTNKKSESKTSSSVERALAVRLWEFTESVRPPVRIILKSCLPGYPDIYLPDYNVVCFIDGCWWHFCQDCYPSRKAPGYKLARQARIKTYLTKRGLTVLRFWEHHAGPDPDWVVAQIWESMRRGRNQVPAYEVLRLLKFDHPGVK